MNGPLSLYLALLAAVGLAYAAWDRAPPRQIARLEQQIADQQADAARDAAALARQRAECDAVQRERPADTAGCLELLGLLEALHAESAVQREAWDAELRRRIDALR